MSTISQLGEIVTWESPPNVTFQGLRDAMYKAGIEPDMARELLPRYAFSRAAKQLDDERVIKKAREDKDHIYFQFTREYFDKQAQTYEYSFEAMLRLNKTTGSVHCQDSNLAAMAHSLILQQMAQRTSSDVTRIVQKLFQNETKYGDLFPIRKQGGAYFVPAHYSHLSDRVESMMRSIGGTLTRWQITPSDANKKSVGETIRDAVQGVIEDYNKAIDDFDPHSSTAHVKQGLCDRVKQVQGMVVAYQNALEGHVNDLGVALAEAAQKLADKLSEPKPEPKPEPPPVAPAAQTMRVAQSDDLLSQMLANSKR